MPERDGLKGWQIHEWHEYQPTRTETEAKAAAGARQETEPAPRESGTVRGVPTTTTRGRPLHQGS